MWALFMIKNAKKQRPVNLDLRTIRFPVTAIASILHRVSGVITFVAVGILLWLLGVSLSSPEGFQTAEYLLEHGMVDMVVRRHDLPETLATLLKILTKAPAANDTIALPAMPALAASA